VPWGKRETLELGRVLEEVPAFAGMTGKGITIGGGITKKITQNSRYGDKQPGLKMVKFTP